ncbi:MAG: HD domain-containing protein, partial [Proteobacteria bacterium]
SLENALLYEEIQGLFESFVKASVEAIESRDPTTSGHSRRVADLTVELAKTVDQIGDGPFRLAQFSRDDLREIEYASLLHDFGKIGVREKVLVKAKKLYDDRLDVVRMRFEYASKALEVELLQRKYALLERGARTDDLVALDLEYAARRAAIESALELVLAANEPTVVAAGDFARIEDLAKETFVDAQGQLRRLLEDDDVTALSIKRGSLTTAEYDEITSHVSHTYRFLSRIPWGKKLRHVPLIAGAHHERMNGTGYPNRLRAEEIPIQSKMMSIADIFDALTASDRPYKRAVPVDKALEILDYNVKDGHIDGELVRIFRESRVWDRAWGDSPPPASLRSR